MGLKERFFSRRDAAAVQAPHPPAAPDPAVGPRPRGTPRPGSVWLDVPFVDNAQVKALGGRWDRDRRSWWIASERWRDELEPWLPRSPVPALVVAMRICCWKCAQPTTAIMGVLIDPSRHPDRDPWGFLAFEDVAELLKGLDREWCSRRGVGTLKKRYSQTVGHSYMSNGCVSCDALQGDFFLRDELIDAIAAGTEPGALVIGRCELARVPDDASLYLGCEPPPHGEFNRLMVKHA